MTETSRSPDDPPPAPLGGVRVGRWGDGAALCALARLLADLGAQVVSAPDRTGGDVGPVDVVVYDEGGERAASARGVDLGALVEASPQVVAVRLSPFGRTGPRAGTAATEVTLQALAGLTAATGAPEDPPLPHRVPLASRTAALSGLVAVAAGLIARERGAGGDHFDIAEYDALLTHLGTVLPAVSLSGARPARRGNRHAMAAPWNTYPCSDTHVMVCTMGESMWLRLASTLDRPELADDLRFADTEARVANVDALDDEIAAWTAARPVSEVLAALRSARIPAAAVSTPQEVRVGEHVRRRGLVTGPGRRPRSPVRSLLLRSHRSPDRPGPAGRPLAPGAPPLSGIRVLEFGAFTAGPGAGRLLAGLGADVLKVEPPHGEGSRRLAQRLGGTGYLYLVNNAGKRGCRLDLDSAPDRDLVERTLLPGADVLLTNLAADTLDASGLGPSHVLDRHALVYVGISGYGADVEGRSFDTVLQAESGIMDQVGAAIGRPRRTAVSSVDVLGGYLGAAAAILGLRERLRTGGGGAADVALLDVAAWVTQDAWCGVPGPPARVEDRGTGPVVVDGAVRAPLLDATQVVREPQVLARSMVVGRTYDDMPYLDIGDPLTSLRRSPRAVRPAPVDQDDPRWCTMPRKGRS